MGAKELENTQGGWVGVVIGIIGLAIYLYDNRERIAEGFVNGYEASQSDGLLD